LDAVPLFHLSLGLAPMMEVALTQVWRRFYHMFYAIIFA
jgi:hypothetical protein